MNVEEFSERLRWLMQQKRQSNGRPTTGYSIEKEKVLSSSTIENLLHAKNAPSVEVLETISKYFNVSLDWLVTGSEFSAPALDTTPVEVPRHIYDLVATELNKVGTIRRGIEEIVSILKSQRNDDVIGSKSASISA